MERFVVTHTKESLWSVSNDGWALATYRTEEEALWGTFALAARQNRAGIKTAVVITQAMQGESLYNERQVGAECFKKQSLAGVVRRTARRFPGR